MNAEQQKRLRELALIMLRDAHGEDFTDEQAAELPAQIEEYRRLTEPQEILSLLEENGRLRANSERYLWMRSSFVRNRKHSLVWYLPMLSPLTADGLDANIDAAIAASLEVANG
ncbi:hypothetical protein P9K38_09865 [Pseudomonas sp. 905_Psudmo1]|nr:hypothetical protein [Pseudomonas sp. 905_Psudmo1]WFS20615.1 hypothetical protein P9K38_09865 [Pseudomonas sp. 905_Psudmo1]